MFSRRFAAFALVFALSAGNLALCAGWEATPEARMACCSHGGTCPMHKADSSGEKIKRLVSQRDADRCCAAAERGSTPSAPSFVSSIAVVPMPVAHPIITAAVPPNFDSWRNLVPIRVRTIPKHLLLSVLLV
jgi:hypothetical protein